MIFSYTPEAVCAHQIDIHVEDGIVKNVRFTRGCAGNAQGVAALVKDMPVDDVIQRLRGITCRNGTSCPDQLARALQEQLIQAAG